MIQMLKGYFVNSGLWNDNALDNDAVFGTSGFTALPGGIRSNNGSFYKLGDLATFWSATEYNSSLAWYKLNCKWFIII